MQSHPEDTGARVSTCFEWDTVQTVNNREVLCPGSWRFLRSLVFPPWGKMERNWRLWVEEWQILTRVLILEHFQGRERERDISYEAIDVIWAKIQVVLLTYKLLVFIYLSYILGNNFVKLRILVFGKIPRKCILLMGKLKPRLKYLSKFSQILKSKLALKSVIFSLFFTSVSNSTFLQQLYIEEYLSPPRFVRDSYIHFRNQFKDVFRGNFSDHFT